MQELIIVCENAFGLDVRMIVEAINEDRVFRGKSLLYHIKGFLCPEGFKLNQNNNSLPVLGTIDDWIPSPEEYYVMGITNPAHKRKVTETLLSRGARFATLRAPWVLAPEDMEFSEGSIIAATSIKMEAHIGKFVILYDSMVGASKIGSYSSAMGYANLTNASYGKGSYIGPNAVVLEEIIIGENVYIHPNSVVVKNVKAGMELSGNPARQIKRKKQ